MQHYMHTCVLLSRDVSQRKGLEHPAGGGSASQREPLLCMYIYIYIISMYTYVYTYKYISAQDASTSKALIHPETYMKIEGGGIISIGVFHSQDEVAIFYPFSQFCEI